MCLEESLYIHNIRDMKVLHTIRETPPNPAGERPEEGGAARGVLLKTGRRGGGPLCSAEPTAGGRLKWIDLKPGSLPPGAGLVTTSVNGLVSFQF